VCGVQRFVHPTQRPMASRIGTCGSYPGIAAGWMTLVKPDVVESPATGFPQTWEPMNPAPPVTNTLPDVSFMFGI
jgi:hypothetical protein